jgi:uncharacterized phage-associated protein
MKPLNKAIRSVLPMSKEYGHYSIILLRENSKSKFSNWTTIFFGSYLPTDSSSKKYQNAQNERTLSYL